MIGCPRSGTTLLRLILDSHPNISCGPETEILCDLSRVVDKYWKALSGYGFEKEYWHRKIREFFDSFQSAYMQRRSKTRWAEKTPRHTLHLDFLECVFPGALYLHIIRDPIDVVASYRSRWGKKGAWRGTRTWPKYVGAGRAFGARIGPDRYLEVRYERLVEDPKPTLQDVMSFIQEPWDDGLLDYRQAKHDVKRHMEFTDKRRREGNESGAIYAARVGAGCNELGYLLRLAVRRRCGKVAHELGYF